MNGNEAERKQRLEAIFDGVIQLPAAEQQAHYLDQACGADTQLRAEIEALVSAYAKSSRFLATSLPSTSAVEAEASLIEAVELAGLVAQIGRYKLRQKLGEGGCGMVFMAEQEEPVRRRVALKVIKPGMDTRHVIARFAAERQ